MFIYDILREQGSQLFGPNSSFAQFIFLKKAMLHRRQPQSCLAFQPFPSPPCKGYCLYVLYDMIDTKKCVNALLIENPRATITNQQGTK